MDVCLGLGLESTIVSLMKKMRHSGGLMESAEVESPLTSNFSWSFVTRDAVQNPSRNAADDSTSTSVGSADLTTEDSASTSRSSADLTSEASYSCSTSSSAVSDSLSHISSSSSRGSVKSSSSRAHLIRSFFSSSMKRKSRKPALLEKVPFGKWSEYLTVYVGTRTGQSEKYVISKSLLAHPLIQVLMKCSEDEYGEDYAVKNGVAIVCDPALFLEVVRAVDENMWSAQNGHADGCDEHEEEQI